MKGWVVDTCVVLDVALNDPEHGVKSAQLLKSRLPDGLLISSVTFVELAPVFIGNVAELKRFLTGAQLAWEESWTLVDTETAFEGWWQYVRLKRQGQTARRPVADLLIGAFASRFRGLITRNRADFQKFYPALKVLSP